MLTRRAFLIGVPGGAAAFLASRWVWAQDRDGPRWFREALEAMRREGRRGLVVVVSDDRGRRREQSRQLTRILDEPSAEVVDVLAGNVAVVVRRRTAREMLEGYDGESVLARIDAQGRVEDQGARESVLEDARRFAEAAARVCWGEGEERLREEAERVRGGMSEEERRWWEALGAPEGREREEAMERLGERAERLAPLLVWTRRHERDPEVAGRATGILMAWLSRSDEPVPGHTLPFGVRWQRAYNGFVYPPDADACPGCGAAAVNPDARRFLEFLAP